MTATCECAALRARYDALLAKVGWVVLRDRLELSETQARIVARLHRAGEGFTKLYDLEAQLPTEGMVDENTVRVHVNRIRRALGRGYVESARLAGYRLSADARAQVDGIMGAV